MIVYVLFVHKKSVSKRKVCIIFIKKIKIKKNTNKPLFSGFFRWFFLVGFLLPTLSCSASSARPRMRRRLAVFRNDWRCCWLTLTSPKYTNSEGNKNAISNFNWLPRWRLRHRTKQGYRHFSSRTVTKARYILQDNNHLNPDEVKYCKTPIRESIALTWFS